MWRFIRLHAKIIFLLVLLILCLIGWGLNHVRRMLLPPHDNLLESIIQDKDKKCIPEEMFKIGFLLLVKGQYNEADQILRYIIKHDDDDPEWFEWIRRAESVLLCDAFYSYYSNSPMVSNTFFVTDIPDESLFDKEAVKRKYGSPNEVVINSVGDETWVYTNAAQDGQMKVGFYGNQLTWARTINLDLGRCCALGSKHPLSWLKLKCENGKATGGIKGVQADSVMGQTNQI